MSEEEVIKRLKQTIQLDKEVFGQNSKNFEIEEILLNYIEKLQKKNKILEEKINKVVLMIDDNYSSKWYDDYETIAGLRDDIYDLLKNKYKGE